MNAIVVYESIHGNTRAIAEGLATSAHRTRCGAGVWQPTDARPPAPTYSGLAMKILIAYDGSPDAKGAVALAGHLFDRSTAVVLTVWEGFSGVVARAEAGMRSTFDFEQIDAECEQWARDRAAEGVGHARAAGLQAEAHVAKRRDSIASAILQEAGAVDADLVVVGNRGFGPVKSMLLGSVSRAVLQRATVPVLVAPGMARCPERTLDDAPFVSAQL